MLVSSRTLTRIAASLVLAALWASALVTGGPAASAEPGYGKPVDGIRCDQQEGSQFHIHQHLTILDHGRDLPVAGDVGRPLGAGCLYWLHTHLTDGIIHVESPEVRSFSLGQFFDIWGQPLTQTNVAGVKLHRGELRVFVDGHRYTGDPRAIALTSHADIVLEAGAPYGRLPKAFDFGSL